MGFCLLEKNNYKILLGVNFIYCSSHLKISSGKPLAIGHSPGTWVVCSVMEYSQGFGHTGNNNFEIWKSDIFASTAWKNVKCSFGLLSWFSKVHIFFIYYALQYSTALYHRNLCICYIMHYIKWSHDMVFNTNTTQVQLCGREKVGHVIYSRDMWWWVKGAQVIMSKYWTCEQHAHTCASATAHQCRLLTRGGVIQSECLRWPGLIRLLQPIEDQGSHPGCHISIFTCLITVRNFPCY